MPTDEKLVQVTIMLSHTDYRDYADKASQLSRKCKKGVSAATLVRLAMKRQKAAIISMQTI